MVASLVYMSSLWLGTTTSSFAADFPLGLRPGLIRPADSTGSARSNTRQEDSIDQSFAPEDSNPFRSTAWQNQYPLSKDAEDLLPDQQRFSEERNAPSEDISEDPRAVMSDYDDEPAWIEWKKTTGSLTWIAPGDEGLGVTTLDVRGSIEFPNCPAVWFVPRVGVNWLNGSQVTDLPGQLYDFSLEGVVAMPLGKRWIIQTAVAPSFYSDLDNTSSDAFRLPARLLAFWKYSDRLTLSGGVLYLDRDDVSWLPVAGLLWNPNDDWKFELMAPRPRIAWRCAQGNDSNCWLYIVGEFGGGTWAVRRASGLDDVATISDYRAMLGFEHKTSRGTGWWLEAGLVFSRRVEYQSKLGDVDLSESALVRAGLSF